MTYKITTEGTNFYYDLHCEHKKIPHKERIIATDALEFISKKELISVSRPIVTKDTISNKYFIDYLFWLNKIDLNKIDEKVFNQTYVEDDFYYAVKTYFIKNLLCFNCKHIFIGGLGFDPVQIYPDNFPLGKKRKIW